MKLLWLGALAAVLIASVVSFTMADSSLGSRPTEKTGTMQPGEYGLTRVNGAPIPVVLAPRGGCDLTLRGGTLSLRADRSFELRMTIRGECPHEAPEDTIMTYEGTTGLIYKGKFSTAGNQVQFDGEGRIGTFQGTAAPGLVTLPWGNKQLAFELGAPGERSFEDEQAAELEEIRAEIAARVAEVRSQGYDCRRDTVLARARPIARADTAGLGQRIAAAFSGYRLSTEMEIACRFPYWEDPYVHLEGLGTGRAWWVERTDVDRDGREDVVTVLTSEADPEQSLLVTLFGSGKAVEVASLGDEGFSVDGTGPEPLIYVDTYGKISTPYRWNGSGFEPIEESDECCE